MKQGLVVCLEGIRWERGHTKRHVEEFICVGKNLVSVLPDGVVGRIQFIQNVFMFTWRQEFRLLPMKMRCAVTQDVSVLSEVMTSNLSTVYGCVCPGFVGRVRIKGSGSFISS